MNLLRIYFKQIIFAAFLSVLFVSGCQSSFPFTLDISECVNEDVLSKMNSDETNFIRSVLFSDDPNTEGSVSRIENYFQKNIKLSENSKITSDAILATFIYPAGYQLPDSESSAIFTNVDHVENEHSAYTSIQWICIARLSDAKIESPKVVCRLMFWFRPQSQGLGEEKLFEVVEEFELKNGYWIPLKIEKRLPI